MDSVACEKRALHAGVGSEVSRVQCDSAIGKTEKDHGGTWTAGQRHLSGARARHLDQGLFFQHQWEHGLSELSTGVRLEVGGGGEGGLPSLQVHSPKKSRF